MHVLDGLLNHQTEAGPLPHRHYTDRGSRYTSEPFQRFMKDHGVICPMSRSGNVWDNAAMESFFSSMKNRAHRAQGLLYQGQAGADVFEYIERVL